jgi:spore germination protein Q
MSQYYNPQGFQPYQGQQGAPEAARQQGGQPYTGPMQQQPFYPSQPGFPTMPPAGGPGTAPTAPPAGIGSLPGQLPLEQSYIENILRLNKGKLVTVFATFEGNSQWNAKEFRGLIEAAGRDHVILSDPQAGTRYLIPMVAVDYITFSEEIEYETSFGGAPRIDSYSPR